MPVDAPSPGAQNGAPMAFRPRPRDPPSALWRRARVALAIVVPLVIAASIFQVSTTVHEACAVCYSSRSTDTSGFGTDPFAPWIEWNRTQEVRDSATCTEMFGGACPHRWERFSSRASMFFLMSMNGGTLAPQPLAAQYDREPRFRARVARSIQAGTLTAAEFRAACTIPANPTPADLADPGRLRLLKMGVILLEAAGESGSARAWETAQAAAAAAKGDGR